MTAAASALAGPDRAPAPPPRAARKMPDELSDRDLILRIGRQDRDAFRAFYDRYGAKILAYVRMLARDREAAEDVTQEVFLAVWRKAPSYRADRGDVPGWLFTIARNRLVDVWRRRGARVVEDGSVDLARFEADPPGSDGHVVSISVRQALTTLKVEQRQALELAYFGGLTYEETARRLDLPLGTLKSRIRAGLALLRDVLSEPDASAPTGSPLEVPPT